VAEKRGWCAKHYKIWRKYGDPAIALYCLGCGIQIRVTSKYGYCKQNPECMRQWAALHYAANRDAILAQQKEYYAANVERITAVNERWAKANPEKKRTAAKRYMARADRTCMWPDCQEFAHPGSPYCRPHKNEDQLRRHNRKLASKTLSLYQSQFGFCPDSAHGGCGQPLVTPEGNHIDHLIPRARGGPDEDWNLQLMHAVCNDRKQDALVPAAIRLIAERGLNISAEVVSAVRNRPRLRMGEARPMPG
jgi:5-methylcytosine-specific restriction endonuclease McrA